MGLSMGLSMGEGGNDYGGKWDWACEVAGLNIIWDDLCVLGTNVTIILIWHFTSLITSVTISHKTK